ncbi:helix-turn-helix domain-containing protein [Pedobacter sp. ISL-68]|uniref:helix-turn-helix domain-containing protein n=1 Tax=unclassified Pedobacter TaxID=2628915 RepID=UPI001BE7AE24|nr:MULTISPECIES: helix-turn-helix domain-containing protein [unclassified Pedobacter]MBT2559792.1 helix-turn-helix domain-containing protein [Pedobacter sp. ISL-64]MBT2592097.1 helix-turn-helix domain-containing protein [Pedobacter sp. ISL-68]
MEIDKMEFSFWMKRIMERFDILSDQLNLNLTGRMVLEDEELLDNQDVLRTLKISTRTLQRYRSSGRLKYFTISGKLYYKLSDVRNFILNSSNNTSSK